MVKLRTSTRKRRENRFVSVHEPGVGALQSRPLTSQVQADSRVIPEPSDLRRSLGKAHQFGHRLSKLSVYPGDRMKATPVQAKLTVGESGNHFEQEADQVAAQVVDHLDTTDTPIPRKKRRDSEQTIGQNIQPFVQTKSDESAKTPDDLEQKIAGARSSGKPLPNRVRQPMERSFGVDFSGVKVHDNAESHQLNRSLSSRAFTTQQDIFFRQGEYNPASRDGQKLLAHELTHVVQQGGGSQRQGQTQSISTSPASHALQRYTLKKRGFTRTRYRVSDDGLMMVKDSSSGSGAKHFYAAPGVIAASNGRLQGINSAFELVQQGSTEKVTAPDGSGKHTLNKVITRNKVDNSQGKAMNTYDDCGTQAGMVMGFDPTNPTGEKRGMKYRDQEGNKANYVPNASANQVTSEVGVFTDDARDKTRKLMTGSEDKARSLYDQMDDQERLAASRRIGVNQFAKAKAGEAYVIKRTGNQDTTNSKVKWDYHWGGVVAQSGGDTVTLENHGHSDSSAQMDDQRWYIRMYGPYKEFTTGAVDDQTYHGENMRSGEYGDTPTTLRVGKFNPQDD